MYHIISYLFISYHIDTSLPLSTPSSPRSAVFVELYFIMSSLWLQQFYYVFGFLALVIAILLVTVAEIAVVLTYFQLSAEDYRWWWRSLFVSGERWLLMHGSKSCITFNHCQSYTEEQYFIIETPLTHTPRRLGLLRIWLQRVLLHRPPPDRPLRALPRLLRHHGCLLLLLLRAHGHRGVPHVLCVCQAGVRGGQD